MCCSLAQADCIFVSLNANIAVMKNTDYTLNELGNIISSEDSLENLLLMIFDMDLEITGIRTA